MENLTRHWTLDPEVTFLNHGSFGACPIPVLEAQQEIRARLEREPVDFMSRRWDAQMDAARAELAAFVGADSNDLAFVPNATTGVNTVLRSLRFERGDELLVTDHEYNASRNALDAAAERQGARIVVARVPYPLSSADAVVDAVLERATSRTRLALLDHVTSPTGLVLPIERIVASLRERGVETLVDGAHAPGMLALDLSRLGAAYYTGNCHKWMCTPKGSALLYVRRDRQREIRPLSISHGANSPRKDRSRFRLEFDFTGTDDPSAFLAVPAAIRFLGTLLPGGWDELRARNRALALRARAILCEALAVEPPAPDSMIGSLAAVPLPPASPDPRLPPLATDPLMNVLYEKRRIEVLASIFPESPRRVLRVSAQIYNHEEQYRYLARALSELL
jgi:isopenicillin-N epimerase